MTNDRWVRTNPEFDSALRACGWGSLVRHMREGDGFGQFNLANKLATSQSVIARLEGRQNIPTIRSLAKVAAETAALVTVTVTVGGRLHTVSFDGRAYRNRRDDRRRAHILLAQANRILTD